MPKGVSIQELAVMVGRPNRLQLNEKNDFQNIKNGLSFRRTNDTDESWQLDKY